MFVTLASVNDQRAELKVVVNGRDLPVTWSIDGPGSIDATGVYSSDAKAPERYVVVFAEFEDEYFGTMAGHLILPLPLSGSSGVLQALTGTAGGHGGYCNAPFIERYRAASGCRYLDPRLGSRRGGQSQRAQPAYRATIHRTLSGSGLLAVVHRRHRGG
ncbi:Uncharacterized protein ALO90_04407 [Pseudomonas amygdali pv. aesculi]|nr:Uncharacterized protein ALO90_04407 [Pseudomonas amygdali pv. aesculi]